MKFSGIVLIAVQLVYYEAVAEEAVAAAEAVSSGSSAVCRCSTVIQSVCGTDNVTYKNICFLQCASLANKAQGLPPIYYQYSGACYQENCICTLEIDPVCASDGKTYANKCLLNCQNRRRNALGLLPLYIVKQGVCTTCNCPNVYDPVCASDNKSYKNPCLLKCENEARKKVGLPLLMIVSKGVCGCLCTAQYDPVCGTDKKTYDNICSLQCESNKRVLQGLSPTYLCHNGPCACDCQKCSNVDVPTSVRQ